MQRSSRYSLRCPFDVGIKANRVNHAIEVKLSLSDEVEWQPTIGFQRARLCCQMFPVSQSMVPTTALVDVMISRDIGSSLMPNCAPSSGRMKSRPISISKP